MLSYVKKLLQLVLTAIFAQYFTVLPGIRSVGVMGDGRTYDYTVGIRAVTSNRWHDC